MLYRRRFGILAVAALTGVVLLSAFLLLNFMLFNVQFGLVGLALVLTWGLRRGSIGSISDGSGA